jgi:cysteine synthase
MVVALSKVFQVAEETAAPVCAALASEEGCGAAGGALVAALEGLARYQRG